MNSNEKWHGNSKSSSNSGAGRDGKPFEKRDVKSILKGSRGAAKTSNDKVRYGDKPRFDDKPRYNDRPRTEENRNSDKLDFKKRDDSRPAFGDRKPYENRDSKPSFGDRKPYQSRDGKPAYGDRKPYENRDNKPSFGDRKPYENREGRPAFGDRKPYENREGRPSFGDRKPYENREGRPAFGDRKPYENREGRPAFGDRKPYENREGRPSFGDRKPYENREGRPAFGDRKPYENREGRPAFGNKPFRKSYESEDERSSDEKLTFKKASEVTPKEYVETRFDNKKDGVTFRKPLRTRDDNYDPNAKYSKKKQDEFQKTYVDLTKPVRLNKFLANAGICSRREADEYIQAGVITVNGEVVSELGVKVLHSDKVMFHNQLIRSEKKVYILLNKPKDCVTTSEDTHDRLTVIDLVKNACSERIYPVGRLDRNTTGVILLTNDGDLASKLTHPKYDKKKIYHVALDKPLVKVDYDQIMAGVTLDDGVIAADSLEFVKADDLKQVGIEIHSGQNRVVRRIFEKLGYKVIRLDRVYFSGLTKKSLARGKYRFLNEREINMLKMGAYE